MQRLWQPGSPSRASDGVLDVERQQAGAPQHRRSLSLSSVRFTMVQSRSHLFLVSVMTLAIGVVSLVVPKSVVASGCTTGKSCTYQPGSGVGFCTQGSGQCKCFLNLSHWQNQLGCRSSI